MASAVLAGLALLIGWLAYHQDSNIADRDTSSEVILVKDPIVRTVKDIEAVVANALAPEDATGVDAPELTTIDGDAIDVLLENVGGRTAVIASVELRINRIDAFEGCLGGGPVGISAVYDVKIPEIYNAPARPFTLQHDVTFAVEGDSVDRLAVTVGPITEYEGDIGTIYDISLSLRLSSGVAVDAGEFVLLVNQPLALITANLADPQAARFVLPECVRANAQLAQQAIRTDRILDPELNEFVEAMRARGYL